MIFIYSLYEILKSLIITLKQDSVPLLQIIQSLVHFQVTLYPVDVKILCQLLIPYCLVNKGIKFVKLLLSQCFCRKVPNKSQNNARVLVENRRQVTCVIPAEQLIRITGSAD